MLTHSLGIASRDTSYLSVVDRISHIHNTFSVELRVLESSNCLYARMNPRHGAMPAFPHNLPRKSITKVRYQFWCQRRKPLRSLTLQLQWILVYGIVNYIAMSWVIFSIC